MSRVEIECVRGGSAQTAPSPAPAHLRRSDQLSPSPPSLATHRVTSNHVNQTPPLGHLWFIIASQITFNLYEFSLFIFPSHSTGENFN